MSGLEIVTQIILAGLSAFGGAFAAFLLERRRDREAQRDQRYLAARFAHLMMLAQYQELLVLDRVYFEPFRGRDDAWRMLPPAVAGSVATPLNIRELSFVIESSDPDLLNRLTIGQQRYETVRKTLEIRELAHSAFQSRVADLYRKGEESLADEEAMARAVGLNIVGRLKSATEAFFEALPSARELLRANLGDLEEFVRDTFPKKRGPEFQLRSEASPGTSVDGPSR